MVASVTDSTYISDDMLRDAPPLEYDDFEGVHLNFAEVEMVEEFESLWDEYLHENPNALPTGVKGKKIQLLQEKIKSIQSAKMKVQLELQRQLDFFKSAQQQMVMNFQAAKEKALKEEALIVTAMEKKLDGVGVSARNMEANGDWDLFFEALEDTVDQSDVHQLPGDGISTIMGLDSHVSPKAKSQVMKPSSQAMFLNNASVESDTLVNSRDFLVRAYRIDNALLQAQVKVLQRDLEKEERDIEINELVGKVLTDHNIWGLLSSSNNSTCGNTVVSRASNASHQSRATPSGE